MKEFNGWSWAIPDEIMERTDLDMYEKVMISVMGRLGALEKPIYPRHQWLAEKMGMSESGIRKVIKRLREKGIIKKEGQQWKVALYSLTVPVGRSSPSHQDGDSPSHQDGDNKRRQSKRRQIKEDVSKETQKTAPSLKEKSYSNPSKEEKKHKPLIPTNPFPIVKNNTPTSYGNEDINHLYDYLKNKLLGTPDGTVKQNRIFVQHLLNKFRKDYPDKNPVETICFLIDIALEDDFHKRNATSFKYLYYNSQKIIQSTKGRLLNPKYISLKR